MTADESPGPADRRSIADGASAAFEILGNETRLAILLALWEAFEPFAADDGVGFSDLRARVGTDDSSQFNYHLDKLVDHFVEQREDGYALTQAGLQFVRAVVAGGGIEEPTVEPTDVDVPCSLCGGQVQIAYADGWVTVLCRDCEGLWAGGENAAEGHLAKFTLEPAGLVGRTAEEIYAAAWVHGFQHIHGMLEGVCPTCSGRVERALDVCPDHADDGVCPTCNRTNEIGARAHCTVCKDFARLTPGVVAKYHPAVVALFHDQGLDLQYGFNDVDRIQRRLSIGESDVALLDREPPRIRVTHEVDGDAVALELDADLDVVALAE